MGEVTTELFTRVHQLSTAEKGINWLTFQDMYGRRNDWLDPTTNTTLNWYKMFKGTQMFTTLNWYKMFKGTQMFDSVGVTPELFETTATTYGVGDGDEVYARLDEYDTLGIPISFMFELRYWYTIELLSGQVDSELEDATIDPEPPPLDDPPPYMTRPDDLVEATVIGLHDA
jgi:hypothetical protein